MKLLVFLFFLISCAHRPTAQNAIFFVVDGMGVAQITGARLYQGGSQSQLALETMDYVGLARTYSTDDFVTDSAAAATALATGVRTYNRSISYSDPKIEPQGESIKLESILSKMKAAGKSVGIISSARITHATPAAYYAHVPHRSMEEEIAAQLLDASVDLAIGGGRDFFLPLDQGGKRKDQRHLINEFMERGTFVASSYEELAHYQNQPIRKPLLALLEKDHLPYDLDRTEGQWDLQQLVDFAIEVLSQNPRGYFLLVEAGRVDHAGHMNMARHVFGDMLAFDRAIARSLQETKRKTLVVATADHETGGLALNGYAGHEKSQGELLLKNHVRDFSNPLRNHGLISWGSGPGFDSSYAVDDSELNFRHKAAYSTAVAYHTAVDVPVMAHGPGAHFFTGFLDNIDLPKLTLKALDLD